MIEMDVEFTVTPDQIANMTAEQVEEYLEERISQGFVSYIKKHIDDMSFLEIEPEPDGTMNISAQLVLCSKANILTGIQRQSTKMHELGLSDSQIEEILMLATENTKGF